MDNMEFDSLEEFRNALKEVDMLLEQAANAEKQVRLYSGLNKAALLLLAAKFENFVQIAAREFIEKLNGLSMHTSLIPEIIKISHTEVLINEIVEKRYLELRKHEKTARLLRDISMLWTDNKAVKLKFETKFKYGRHGEEELRRVFRKIGIDDIFESVTVKIINYSMLDAESEVSIDFKGKMNSFTGIRNSIIHNDTTPGLTHRDIHEYRGLFLAFAIELMNILKGRLAAFVTKKSR